MSEICVRKKGGELIPLSQEKRKLVKKESLILCEKSEGLDGRDHYAETPKPETDKRSDSLKNTNIGLFRLFLPSFCICCGCGEGKGESRESEDLKKEEKQWSEMSLSIKMGVEF